MCTPARLSSRCVGLRDQRGAVAVLVVVALLPLLGFAALAVDVGNLGVARTELQNAADAGALAGARCLYNQRDDHRPEGCTNSGALGTVNTHANQVARAAAQANLSQKTPVDVNLTEEANGPDVQRGHWRWATRTFTPNDSTAAPDLANSTTAQLDANPAFINAVRVTARRQATPVQAFFSRVLGFTGFELQASAVAYLGFAGTLMPGEADQPIAICKDKLRAGDGTLLCTVGRMVPSSDDPTTSETAGWTSFEQPEEGENCGGGASNADIRPLVCLSGNPKALTLGEPVLTNNGQIQDAFDRFHDCWDAATDRKVSWTLTLPVLECVGNNIAPCSDLVGAVNIDVIWVQKGQPDPNIACNETQANKIEKAAPCKMDDWVATSGTGVSRVDPDTGQTIEDPVNGNARWDSFAAHFNLRTGANQLATVANAGWQQKTIYFKPDCEPHEPQGDTGTENFGILARIPRLVQ